MMDWFSRIDVGVLLLMLVNTVVILSDRFYQYSRVRQESQAFFRNAEAALRDGRFDDVIRTAARFRRSHVATVIGAGLTAFCSAPLHLTDGEAVDAAERAVQRRRKVLNAELGLGLGTLATIASSAPFIGLLGTCAGIMNAFRGIGMEKSTAMAMVASYLAEALVTTGVGLVVAVPALCLRNYFRRRVDLFDTEMSNARLETITYLNGHREWRRQLTLSDATRSASRSEQLPGDHAWEVRYDRQRALLSALCCCALYVVFVFGRGTYLSYAWRQSFVESPPSVGSLGGQQSVSPDRHYRAVIPVLYRWKETSSTDSHQPWLCSNPSVALRIIPNDRAPEWKPYRCEEETKYALEQTPALLTWNCSVPTVIAWRTNDEVLVQCDDSSADNAQLIRVSSFPRIGVLGSDRRRLNLQVVHPRPECPE